MILLQPLRPRKYASNPNWMTSLSSFWNQARLAMVATLTLAVFDGCGAKQDPARSDPASASRKHSHTPPHGGTAVELGEETAHLELVLDRTTGTLAAFALDGHMENFVKLSEPSIELIVKTPSREMQLVLQGVANQATGETVGNTSQFEVQSDWLKTATNFDAVIRILTIRGSTFTNVAFNFPKGNEAGK